MNKKEAYLMYDDTCIMIDDHTKIVCSVCDYHFDDEIVWLFEDPDDFKFCPHCGRKIIKETKDA